MFPKSTLQKKITRILGFEISENNLTVVEIQLIKNNIHITNGFRLTIPVFQDLNQTVSLISQNLRALHIKTKDCAFGLAMQYFKLFPVPIPETIPQEEIDSIILQEGNINTTNDYFSWIPLSNTKRVDTDGISRYDILGITLPKSIVDLSVLIAQKCGLRLLSLSPSFLSLGVYLDPKSTNNLMSTLWISQLRSELVVWSGQEPIYEHLFLTHQIGEQLFQSMTYIQNQLSGVQLSTILTCGLFSKETNLSQLPYSIQNFVLPPEIIDSGKVLQKMSISEIITPLGIALSSSNNAPYSICNLLHEPKLKVPFVQDIFKDSSKKPIAIKLKVPAIFKSIDEQVLKFIFISLIILVVSFFSSLFIKNFLIPSVESNFTTLENRVMLGQSHLTKLLNLEKTHKVLSVKAEYLSELIDKRKPWSKILREIADMTPKGLWIDRLDIRNNKIDIFGRALDVDSVANFSINLNYTAKLIGKAQIVALRKFQEEGIDIIEFQLALSIKSAGEKDSKDNDTPTKT